MGPRTGRRAGEDGMDRIGIIMHGVTGRMGYNQHLVRSILAIRDQGGIELPSGKRLQVDPIIVGRNAEKMEALAQKHGIKRWAHRPRRRARQPRRHHLLRRRHHADARRAAVEGARRRQARLLREADLRRPRRRRRRWPRRRAAPASSMAWCRTSCSCPACRSSAILRDSGFFGRILSVRGEFGYWVFEGDWGVAPQRPSWNYRKADGGGIILDMLCHWRYVLDNLFGEVKARHLPRRHPHPRAHRREGQALQVRRRRRRLRHLRARGRRRSPSSTRPGTVRVRRDDLVTFQVDGTHGSAVAGLPNAGPSTGSTPRSRSGTPTSRRP